MVLVSLVVANGVLIATNRASIRAHNPTAWWVTVLAVLAALLTLYWPWLAGALQLAALSPQALAVALGCGVLGWPVMVLLRTWRVRERTRARTAG